MHKVIIHPPEPPGLLARRHELMLLPPPCEGHPILHVLEEVCLLDREVLVHYLEKLAVSEDVWSADLEKNCHFQTIQEARIEQVFSIRIVSFLRNQIQIFSKYL